MKAANGDVGSIHTKVERFLLSYRSTPHTVTKETPAKLFMGRQVRTRLDHLRPSLTKSVRKRQKGDESRKLPRHFKLGEHILVRDYRLLSDR